MEIEEKEEVKEKRLQQEAEDKKLEEELRIAKAEKKRIQRYVLFNIGWLNINLEG